MGAGSVIIDSFPKEDWENTSEIALNGVLECSSKPGFSIFGQESGMTLKNVEELKAKLIAKRQTSSSARRQNPSSAMGSGGACDSLSEEEEVFSEEDVPGTQSAGNWSGPKASHSNKRARSKSPSSTGQQGFHQESGRYVGLVETMFRDSVQQREEMMLGLKKQVISLNRELNLAKERAKGAAATTEKLQVAEREVSEQREIAGAAVAELRRMTLLNEVCVQFAGVVYYIHCWTLSNMVCGAGAGSEAGAYDCHARPGAEDQAAGWQ